MKVFLDTNALMAISEFKLDIFSELSEYSLQVLSGTIDELEKIKKEQRGKYKIAAQLGLSLLKAKKIKIVKSAGNVDNLLVEKSKNNLVLTQDIALKRRLHKPYLTIRQKKKIVMVE